MGKRIRAFDVVRGYSVVSMVLFHLCYDIKFIAGKSLPWFAPPLQDVWRASISWVFLLVAGCMCCFSRNNLRRAAKYGCVALLIFVATTVAAVDVPISFGIIYCMAACTLVEALLEKAGHTPRGPIAALGLAVCFLVTLNMARHKLGIGPWSIELPQDWYATPWLSWLGLPGPGFVSGDYYPLVPFVFLYLCGSAIGWWWRDAGYPALLYDIQCEPLEFVGRHALPIYIAHQPALLLLCLCL